MGTETTRGDESNLFEEWPHQWFGLWRDRRDYGAEPQDIPLLEDIADPTWNPPDRGELVRYLAQCPVSIASPLPRSVCPLCGERLDGPSSQRSDGTWVWPSSLPHYVERHHVRLPDRMVEYIRSNAHLPPESPVGLVMAAGDEPFSIVCVTQPPASHI